MFVPSLETYNIHHNAPHFRHNCDLFEHFRLLSIRYFNDMINFNRESKKTEKKFRLANRLVENAPISEPNFSPFVPS